MSRSDTGAVRAEGTESPVSAGLAREDAWERPPIRLLLPYSGSRTADAALDVAIDWARALSADVWVLYVRSWDTCRGGHYFVETRREAHAVGQVAMRLLRRHGVSASELVRDADREHVARVIVTEADTMGARLIVLGSRARGRLSRALQGSTSTAVARLTRTPLILVSGSDGTDVVVRWPRQ